MRSSARSSASIKDRLETLERIATDQPSKLARDIDALTMDKGGNA